jgi:hypothetical protein
VCSDAAERLIRALYFGRLMLLSVPMIVTPQAEREEREKEHRKEATVRKELLQRGTDWEDF